MEYINVVTFEVEIRNALTIVQDYMHILDCFRQGKVSTFYPHLFSLNNNPNNFRNEMGGKKHRQGLNLNYGQFFFTNFDKTYFNDGVKHFYEVLYDSPHHQLSS